MNVAVTERTCIFLSLEFCSRSRLFLRLGLRCRGGTGLGLLDRGEARVFLRVGGGCGLGGRRRLVRIQEDTEQRSSKGVRQLSRSGGTGLRTGGR